MPKKSKGCKRGAPANTEPKLHLYGNYVSDYFVAESLEEAQRIALDWYMEPCEMLVDDCQDYVDEIHPIKDSRVLKYYGEDGGEQPVAKTAAEWAALNGKGFWATTEC